MLGNDNPDLICPRCNAALKQVRTTHGVLWVCDQCGGRAVGVELLRRTFTPESINPLWRHAISGEGQTGCRCPDCGHPMTEVRLSDKCLVRVDVCRLCHFVWFDAHEVDSLVPRPPKPEPKEEQVPQKAREAIALLKVQQLSDKTREQDVALPTTALWSAIADFFGL
jgi:Zn-finger nucleic acid-binding protein